MDNKARKTTGIVAAGLLLAACGGGGGGSASAPVFVGGTEVPVSATITADGAYAFVAEVAAARDDGAEPLLVGDAVLATSETDEPKAVQ